jgi:3-oxoacyl-[acyl-carrier protein] reductase
MTSFAGIPEFQLAGKVAVVTGGNRSIGRAACELLAEAGANVVVAGRDAAGCERVSASIVAGGGAALPVACDVSDAAAVDRLFATAVDRFGHVDICLVNAGIFSTWQSSDAMPIDEWDRVCDIDLRGAMLTALAAGKQMIKQGDGGSIITISSVAGVVGLKGTLAYSAAKHGLVGMTRTMAIDWAEQRVRVNCIAPGFITRDVEPLHEDPAAVEFVTRGTPMGRWGTSREVALAVFFLASPASSYVTGAVLCVDGGWCAQ